MPAARVLYAPPDEFARYLPESPRRFQFGGRDCLVWVTIQTAPGSTGTGLIHVADWPVTPANVRSVAVPGRVAFALPTDRPGVALVGVEKSLELWDLARGVRLEVVATLPGDDDPRTTLNDAEILPGGVGIVCGTKDIEFREPVAHLYLFTAVDRRVTVLAGGQTCSNGKVFASHDGSLTLFDIDTPRKVVTRYGLDLKTRQVAEQGVAVDLRHRPDFPDGMVDAGGGTAVIALYHPDPVPTGSAIHVNLTTGAELGTITVPGSPRVTCPLLWTDGTDATLVLTTAVEGMPPDQRAKCPEAGSLFVADFGPVTPPSFEVVRLG